MFVSLTTSDFFFEISASKGSMFRKCELLVAHHEGVIPEHPLEESGIYHVAKHGTG